MTISEKVAYIKGLADGLVLDDNNKQDKVLKAIIDVLDDIALTVEDLEDNCAELGEQLDAVDEDLAALEDVVYEEDDDDCCCDCEDDMYEVECPNCHDLIYVDEDMLCEESIDCPNCGTKLEFDFDCDCDCDEDCDCGCHDGGDCNCKD